MLFKRQMYINKLLRNVKSRGGMNIFLPIVAYAQNIFHIFVAVLKSLDYGDTSDIFIPFKKGRV